MSTIMSLTRAADTPVEIDIRGGSAAAHQATRRLPLDDVLLNALPPARRVLAIGCGNGDLGRAYQRLHPEAQWQDAGDTPPCAATPDRCDLIVLGSGLGSNANPQHLLRTLMQAATDDASLVVQLENSATLSTIERMIEADLSGVGSAGVDDERAHSPASVYKLLMNAGWMPTLAGQRDAEPANQDIATAALAIADVLCIPRGTARRTLAMDQFVIRAHRPFRATPETTRPACFSVVVPTTRDRQLRLNIDQSPGLKEVDARVVSCRHARHAAEALQQALPHCDTDWVLLCHQDVYFPTGFGERLNALLASVPVAERDRTLIGFVGMGVNAATQQYQPSGFVIDRLHAADHPASDHAVSIDELAIVMSRRSIHRIDPALGWHLWATDLCLTAICRHQVFPRIVRLPLFHNSVTDYQLPTAFYDAAVMLAEKHASFGPIPTLCGTIDAAFLAAHGRPPRAAAPVEPVRAAPGLPPADDAVMDSAGSRLDLIVQPATRDVDALIADGQFDAATDAIYRSVHLSYTQEGVKHRALYYPEFDRQLMRLAQALGDEPRTLRSGVPGVPLLIATELYNLGGHSRVLDEVSREMKQPVLVLTDLFRTYHRDPAQLERVRQRCAHTQVIVLPDVSLWEKCRMLRMLDQHLVPRSTLYFGHHQDPIPFIGTLAQPGLRRLFVHHGDHNPSLGCTLPSVRHVDLSEGVRDLCSGHLSCAPGLLPLHAADLGARIFPEVRGTDFSVVSSGHPAKFERSGPMALQLIVRAALDTVRGAYHHIGPLDAAWVDDIRRHLSAQAINPDRFVHHGLVPSLWAHLKTLDAAVYIGSAPIGGGKAAIEAQGCGYPLAYFASAQESGLPDHEPLYASRSLKWATPGELSRALASIGAQHSELSRQARQLYMKQHSHVPFKNALQRLLQA